MVYGHRQLFFFFGPLNSGGALSAVRVQCSRSATIWVSSSTGDQYFVVLGASLLPLAQVLMLLPHWGYGIFGFSPTHTPFHAFLLISTMDFGVAP